MSILILSGSHRTPSNSLKVANYLDKQCQLQGIDTLGVMDLSGLDIPIWSEDIWSPESEDAKRWQQQGTILRDASGYIIVAPEYAGMCPPILKNFLMMCSKKDTGHKPAMLVGVSTGRGGHYPISELRQYGFKNNYLCMLPANVIVTEVDQVFNNDAEPNENEMYLNKQITHSLKVLQSYSTALAHVRNDPSIDLNDFPYGV